jgi:ketosteroid isomerase-like protein
VYVDHVGVLAGPDYWVTCFEQLYRSPALISSGRKRLYWQRDADGRWRIVGREFVPGRVDLLPAYLAAKRQEVAKLLEQWRQSWKSADLSTYLSFYESDARQDSRRGVNAIAEHKKRIWAKNPPADIFFERPTVTLNDKGLEVRFLQTYAAQNGYSDKGVKTMILEPHGSSWTIVSESWEPLS